MKISEEKRAILNNLLAFVKKVGGDVYGMIRRQKKWYLIATVIFLLIITVFDKYSLINGMASYSRIREMERQKSGLLREIARDSSAVRHLSDDEIVEKTAREMYLMKREGETIYIVPED